VKILFLVNHELFAQTVVSLFLVDHEVKVTPNIGDALELFRTGEFELALADYDLDDGKGDAFVRTVRTIAPNFPIVAVSARDEGNAALVHAGANSICHKKDFRRIGSVIAILARETNPTLPC